MDASRKINGLHDKYSEVHATAEMDCMINIVKSTEELKWTA
jgi:hypothetical protein